MFASISQFGKYYYYDLHKLGIIIRPRFISEFLICAAAGVSECGFVISCHADLFPSTRQDSTMPDTACPRPGVLGQFFKTTKYFYNVRFLILERLFRFLSHDFVV